MTDYCVDCLLQKYQRYEKYFAKDSLFQQRRQTLRTLRLQRIRPRKGVAAPNLWRNKLPGLPGLRSLRAPQLPPQLPGLLSLDNADTPLPTPADVTADFSLPNTWPKAPGSLGKRLVRVRAVADNTKGRVTKRYQSRKFLRSLLASNSTNENANTSAEVSKRSLQALEALAKDFEDLYPPEIRSLTTANCQRSDPLQSVIVIDTPGIYQLWEDLTLGPGLYGLHITSSDVTIDLNGHTLSGEQVESLIYCQTNTKNLIIKNGQLRNRGDFVLRGIDLHNVLLDNLVCRATHKTTICLRTISRLLVRDVLISYPVLREPSSPSSTPLIADPTDPQWCGFYLGPGSTEIYLQRCRITTFHLAPLKTPIEAVIIGMEWLGVEDAYLQDCRIASLHSSPENNSVAITGFLLRDCRRITATGLHIDGLNGGGLTVALQAEHNVSDCRWEQLEVGKDLSGFPVYPLILAAGKGTYGGT